MMPRIVTARVYRWLWVAFTLNDVGESGRGWLGFTEQHAWNRAVKEPRR